MVKAIPSIERTINVVRPSLSDILAVAPSPAPAAIELEMEFPIDGTSLRGGFYQERVVIYDSETSKILFRGEIGYSGKFNGKHIVLRDDEVDGKFIGEQSIVDEDGNILFGGHLNGFPLALIDSTSKNPIDIDLQRHIDNTYERLTGNEDTLVGLNRPKEGIDTLDFYNVEGGRIAKDIPAYRDCIKKHGFFKGLGEILPATRLTFDEIDGQKVLEVKYVEDTEVYLI